MIFEYNAFVWNQIHNVLYDQMMQSSIFFSERSIYSEMSASSVAIFFLSDRGQSLKGKVLHWAPLENSKVRVFFWCIPVNFARLLKSHINQKQSSVYTEKNLRRFRSDNIFFSQEREDMRRILSINNQRFFLFFFIYLLLFFCAQTFWVFYWKIKVWSIPNGEENIFFKLLRTDLKNSSENNEEPHKMHTGKFIRLLGNRRWICLWRHNS